jgi:serine/threonine protein kinase/Tol biopolymer transport system component
VPLAQGDVFAGYTVVRQLGSGGMGAVYLVRHPRLPRFDALKLLRPELTIDPAFAARFLHEADVVSRLSHRNIVSVLDRGEDAGQLWLTMQYIDGIDAEKVLAAAPRGLPPARVAHIIAETAAALDSAHRNNLIHRDVKPANILLAPSADGDDEPEQVFLTDFGIAKSLDGATKLTRTGSILATFDYASPEQIEARPVDGRSDVYALGCVLYRLLTGSTPYPGDSVAALMHGHLTLPPPRPTKLLPWLAPAIDDVVARAMAKDPAERFPTCRALAEAAGRALAPVSAPSTVPMADAEDQRRTDRLAAGGLAATAVQRAVTQPPPQAQPQPTPRPTPQLPPPPVRRPPQPQPGFVQPEEERPNRVRWALAAAGLAVLVVAGIAVWLLNRGDGGNGGSSSTSTSTTATTTASLVPQAAKLSDTTLVAPRNNGQNTDLYLIDADTGATVGRVTSGPEQDVAPLLSPDRRTIAYVQQTAAGIGVLRVVATDGSGDRPMFATPPPGCDSVLRPAWNPVDANQLALVCIDSAGAWTLRIIGVDGTVLRPIDVGHERVDDLSYSPDGSTLVYWAADGDDGAALFIRAADGTGEATQLTEGVATDDGDAVWSPDGERIAFRRVAGNTADIYVMDADGGNLRALLTAPGTDQDPTWSPDGRRIAFKSDRPGPSPRAGNHVWVVGSDGTGAVQLPPGSEGVDDSAPAWGPR